MTRTMLLVLAALALALVLAASVSAQATATPAQDRVSGTAYTVVLKDGRRLEARDRYRIDGGEVRFTGTNGQDYRFPVDEVDLDATSAANRPGRKPAAAGKPPRKGAVWTNEDIDRLRARQRINVVGTGAGAAAETPAKPAGEGAAAGEAPAGEAGEEESAAEEETPEAEKPKPLPPREQDPEYYRDRLRPLRDELAQVNRRISDLQRSVQTGGGGAGGGGVGLLQSSDAGVDPRDRLAQLQRRRDELQRQISSIEAEARRNGLNPGQIR